MGITPQELTLLETRPHRTKLWLSIYTPNTVLACRVNDAGILKGARTITYDSITDGSYLLVESAMVMYVGTSLGANDKGRIRVKSITNTEIVVAENSHIEWEDNLYLTIVNFYEITAIYPRIIQNPTDPTKVIFYKDYDIAYTNQNTILGSFINMGTHYAGFVDSATGEEDVYYSASGTHYVGASGTTLSYHWWFQGGDPTGSHAHTPGYITYDTPGHYTTRLIVSGSNGAGDSSYRHVSIYDKPGEGSNVPILSWQLNSLNGDRSNGGYVAQITIREDIPEETIRDGSLVVIFAEDWYGTTKQSIGGNALNRASIVFAGYIVDGTILYDWQEKSVDFEVGSPTQIMKDIEGFSVSVESKNTPATWFQLKDMNVAKALYHYLRWHSTVLKTSDFEFSDEDFRIQYFDSDRESLYSAINTLMEGTLIGNVVSDRQGKIWAEIDTSAIASPTSYKETSKLALNNDKWMGQPIIEEQQTAIVSYLEMGGIYYEGPPTHASQALMSEAPGSAPNYRGRVERHQGLALSSQAQLNILTGNVLAYKNARYPLSSYNLSGNYRNYDIAPQSLIPVTIQIDDTPRRISFSDKLFTIEEMELEYNSESEIFLSAVGITEITDGDPATTLIIPAIPPIGDDGGFSIPPLEFPPFPAPANLGNYASAKDISQGDYPPDDPDYPGFNIDAGDWGDVLFTSGIIGGTWPDWRNNISFFDRGANLGYWRINYSGKYHVNIIVHNTDEKEIKIAVSKSNLVDWTLITDIQKQEIAHSDSIVISADITLALNAGDILTVLLYNGDVANVIHGYVISHIMLVDLYSGHG